MYMIKKLFFFTLCSLLLILFACKFNPDVQGKGSVLLQGVWEQDSVQYHDQLLEYTRHKFTFSCDSFYATLITKAKVNQYPDSCFNGGNWSEYAKGTYVFRNDTLYLLGTFTKSNFKQKISGCYRIGQYLPVFLVKEHTPGKLIFQDQHINMTLNLKQKITCDPKPL
ncbi:MAG TPA: fumarate hydratase [Sphingobacteriaceae bacterium]|nr:fumarate hydratase [Sphingobacteriaceae bacterium]